MFWTVAFICFVLWVLGLVSGAQTGVWVHLFLVASLISTVLAVSTAARLSPRR